MTRATVPLATLIVCASVSILGVFMIAGGLLGLLQAEQFSTLATPSLAWPLITVGAVLDTGAMVQLLNALKRQRASS